jgi:hypothetical protein
VAKAIWSGTQMACRSHKPTFFLNERKPNSYIIILLLVLETITKASTFMLLPSVMRIICKARLNWKPAWRRTISLSIIHSVDCSFEC